MRWWLLQALALFQVSCGYANANHPPYALNTGTTILGHHQSYILLYSRCETSVTHILKLTRAVCRWCNAATGLADMAPELKPGWRNTPLSGLSESVLLASTSSSSSKHGRRTKAGTIGECTDLWKQVYIFLMNTIGELLFTQVQIYYLLRLLSMPCTGRQSLLFTLACRSMLLLEL